ncbi:MAG: hypothetical protein EBU73_08235 [Chitinophagia bacterium]|nr:hypothetical protein [Chitinophagia bacterium]
MSSLQFNRNQGFTTVIHFRTMLKSFFLLILSFTLFTQHGSWTNISKSVSGHHYSTAIPTHHEFTALEIELEEDENLYNPSQDLDAHCSIHYKLDTSSYEAVLRARFLQLLSSLEQQPSSPLFVLHHSWKSFPA